MLSTWDIEDDTLDLGYTIVWFIQRCYHLVHVQLSAYKLYGFNMLTQQDDSQLSANKKYIGMR